jgi:hypothetical protein
MVHSSHPNSDGSLVPRSGVLVNNKATPLVILSDGTFWEAQGGGILIGVQGELVEDRLQVCDHIDLSLLHGVQH